VTTRDDEFAGAFCRAARAAGRVGDRRTAIENREKHLRTNSATIFLICHHG
jgi:hypothetical protein